MISRFKQSLENDQAVTLAWSTLRDTQLAELVARQAFGGVLLDCQHSLHNEASLVDCIPGIVSAGKVPLVRIPVGRWDLVERSLDFGALGVVAPMINTVDDARNFASAAKYLPSGSRSFGPRNAANLYNASIEEYVLSANDCTYALAQIETREAYENLDEILSVDGIDGILMGPSDFSISVSGEQVPDPYGPATIKLVEDIAERTRKAGKVAAAFTASADHANQVYTFGYRIISLAMDSGMVAAGANASFEGLNF